MTVAGPGLSISRLLLSLLQTLLLLVLYRHTQQGQTEQILILLRSVPQVS